jgi:hypothetical protein
MSIPFIALIGRCVFTQYKGVGFATRGGFKYVNRDVINCLGRNESKECSGHPYIPKPKIEYAFSDLRAHGVAIFIVLYTQNNLLYIKKLVYKISSGE